MADTFWDRGHKSLNMAKASLFILKPFLVFVSRCRCSFAVIVQQEYAFALDKPWEFCYPFRPVLILSVWVGNGIQDLVPH